MSAFSADPREFESTYFALRIGLLFSALLVMMAPAAVLIMEGKLPPSISDSWYTSASTVFVIGLASASMLLMVVRGDTFTEQTLLNVAGGLGMLVAGAACWPKGARGEPLPSYDPAVVESSEYAIVALVVVVALVRTIAIWLPEDLVGAGWHIRRLPKLVLRSFYPILILAIATMLLINAEWLATHIHGPSAVAMFALLGVIALLRTSLGLELLNRIGDTPVDESLSALHEGDSSTLSTPTKVFDTAYKFIAIAMGVVVLAAVVMHSLNAEPGLVLFVEAMLLVLFGLFWGLQTVEAWVERRRRHIIQVR
jgi:hypothetical protein